MSKHSVTVELFSPSLLCISLALSPQWSVQVPPLSLKEKI